MRGKALHVHAACDARVRGGRGFRSVYAGRGSTLMGATGAIHRAPDTTYVGVAARVTE